MMVTDRGMIWGRSCGAVAVGLGGGVEDQAPVVGVLEQLGHGEGHRAAAGSRAAATSSGISSIGLARSPPRRSRVPMVPATMASNTPWPDEPRARAKARTSSSGA